jgi:hypothetical protein
LLLIANCGKRMETKTMGSMHNPSIVTASVL